MTNLRQSTLQPWSCRTILVCAVAPLVMVASCDGSAQCIVKGTVLVNERPAEGVYVLFHSFDQASLPHHSGSARTAKDGAFSLVVSEPGESSITVFWPAVKVVDGESIEGGDLFAGLYRDPKRPVLTVTVRGGENTLPPIKLTRPTPAKPKKSSRRSIWSDLKIRRRHCAVRTRFMSATEKAT